MNPVPAIPLDGGGQRWATDGPWRDAGGRRQRYHVVHRHPAVVAQFAHRLCGLFCDSVRGVRINQEESSAL